jgi:type III restriction enzyme/adenine-specific DNA-methyltransferase
MLSIGSGPDDIIVDFFGGSSTTAHAVMELNSQDGGSRKYILVQWKEECAENSQAYKADYRTIDEIGMERIKRAAKKIKEENPLFAGDLGFKHYTLEEVPQNTLDKLETYDPNVMLSTEDTLNLFGRDTVLATWLVNDGYGLGAKTEDVVLDKYHATLCGNHLYMTDADFTEEDMTALVDRYQSDPAFNPDCIVLFGYSFGHNAKDMLEKNKPTINLVKDKNIIIDVRY